jgi:hypothetical protein
MKEGEYKGIITGSDEAFSIIRVEKTGGGKYDNYDDYLNDIKKQNGLQPVSSYLENVVGSTNSFLSDVLSVPAAHAENGDGMCAGNFLGSKFQVLGKWADGTYSNNVNVHLIEQKVDSSQPIACPPQDFWRQTSRDGWISFYGFCTYIAHIHIYPLNGTNLSGVYVDTTDINPGGSQGSWPGYFDEYINNSAEYYFKLTAYNSVRSVNIHVVLRETQPENSTLSPSTSVTTPTSGGVAGATVNSNAIWTAAALAGTQASDRPVTAKANVDYKGTTTKFTHSVKNTGPTAVSTNKTFYQLNSIGHTRPAQDSAFGSLAVGAVHQATTTATFTAADVGTPLCRLTAVGPYKTGVPHIVYSNSVCVLPVSPWAVKPATTIPAAQYQEKSPKNNPGTKVKVPTGPTVTFNHTITSNDRVLKDDSGKNVPITGKVYYYLRGGIETGIPDMAKMQEINVQTISRAIGATDTFFNFSSTIKVKDLEYGNKNSQQGFTVCQFVRSDKSGRGLYASKDSTPQCIYVPCE